MINPICAHCGRVHTETCPRIKSVEYTEAGTVRRIEFFLPVEWTPYLPPTTYVDGERFEFATVMGTGGVGIA